MNRLNGSILAGVLLGAASVGADIVVDDFQLVTGQNKITGNWLADSDQWAAIGGHSRVLDVTTQADLVQGEGCASGCYAGHNIFKAYVEDASTLATLFQADIKVQKDVSAEKKWAYAGWVMNFTAERGKDGKQPWELQPWEKGNEVDISSCEFLELTLGFSADRQLWISLYNPFIEQAKATNPQYGWRYKGTGAIETRRFKLAAGGLSGISTKWTDPAAAPLDLKKITRLNIFYEGQRMLEVKEPAPYDSALHRLTITKVALTGAACKIVGKDSLGNVKEYGTVGVNDVAGRTDRLEMSVVSGRINFAKAAEMGDVKVTVRSLAGQVVARGDVGASRNSLDVSSLQGGVYLVQASSGARSWNNTVTLLK